MPVDEEEEVCGSGVVLAADEEEDCTG